MTFIGYVHEQRPCEALVYFEPRATCLRCRRDVAITSAGKMRPHYYKTARSWCK